MASVTAQKRANVVAARIIPPILLGALIYVSYAITKPLCSKSAACLCPEVWS